MSEPIKLTQAQALFAVLAGAAQARRDRVYYRDTVLKTTLYSPIETFSDKAVNTASIEIEYVFINPVPIELVDLAVNTASITIEKTIAAKPEATDYAVNNASISIQAFFTRKFNSNDAAINNASVAVSKFNGIYPTADDKAKNTASITVVKL